MAKDKKTKSAVQIQIIDSVHKLLHDRDIKQADLARGIEMDPPRLSRAMNKEGDAQFTFDMLIKIADYFDVSTDYLLGRNKATTADPISNQDLCRRIMNLISNEVVRVIDVSVEEDIMEPSYGDPEDKGGWAYPYEYGGKKKSTYKMLYFSNYVPIPDVTDLSDAERDDIEYDFYTGGNDNEKGRELNSFIEYYLKFYDLYKNNGLEQSMFETAIEDRIKQMKY